LADGQPAVLRAVAEVLEEHGVDVLAESRDGVTALAQIVEHAPDVAVVDAALPQLTGIEIARSIADEGTETRLVLYAASLDELVLNEAIHAGVRGFVLKEAPLDELVRAVDLVGSGAGYVDPALAGTLLAVSDGATQLTRREREVLCLLADGHSNDAIGRQLSISPETVRTHVRKAMDKLGAATRTQAVATALRKSLIA